MKTIKGIEFTNSQGEIIESYSLIPEGYKYAVAVADFRNGQLERYDVANGYLNLANEWLSNLKK